MELDEAMREASAQVLEALEEQYPEDEPVSFYRRTTAFLSVCAGCGVISWLFDFGLIWLVAIVFLVILILAD